MKLVKSTPRCILWSTIRVGWDKFVKITSFEIGDGKRVRFWQDISCGNYTSNISFYN